MLISDRVGEDQVGLEHGRDLGADRLERHVAEVVAVDPDPADLRVDQAGDQADQGVLGVLVQAHDRRPRPGRDLGRDAFEQHPARAALEGDVLEA